MDLLAIRQQLATGHTIYELPLRVTFYARVSTDKDAQRNSLGNQVQYYTDLISDNETWQLVPGYVDEGISGASTRRRDRFLQMIADAEAGRFDFIITKQISRFSRSTLDSILYTQRLLRCNVGVLFQNDGINTLDPDSEFRLVVMAGVAQDELRKLSQRLKFGFHQAIRNGHVLGNDRIWGYTKDHSRLVIEPREAEAVRLIFTLYGDQGWGMRRIARALTEQGFLSAFGNPFNPRTIQNILTNPKYKGWYCGNKTRSLDYRTHRTAVLDPSEWVCYPDPQIPAIVSEALWDRANARYRARSTKRAPAPRYPYSGLIRCGLHDASCHRTALPSGTIQWRCRCYRLHGAAGCPMPPVNQVHLDAILAALFQRLYPDPDAIISELLHCIALATPSQYLEQAQRDRQAALLRQRRARLLELHLAGGIDTDTFLKRAAPLDAQLDALKSALESSAVPEQALRQTAEAALTFSDHIDDAIVAAPVSGITLAPESTADRCVLLITLKSGACWRAVYVPRPFAFRLESCS